MEEVSRRYSLLRGRVMVNYTYFMGFSRCVVNVNLFSRVHKVVWNSFKVPDRV